jgi:hypothetical protein
MHLKCYLCTRYVVDMLTQTRKRSSPMDSAQMETQHNVAIACDWIGYGYVMGKYAVVLQTTMYCALLGTIVTILMEVHSMLHAYQVVRAAVLLAVEVALPLVNVFVARRSTAHLSDRYKWMFATYCNASLTVLHIVGLSVFVALTGVGDPFFQVKHYTIKKLH